MTFSEPNHSLGSSGTTTTPTTSTASLAIPDRSESDGNMNAPHQDEDDEVEEDEDGADLSVSEICGLDNGFLEEAIGRVADTPEVPQLVASLLSKGCGQDPVQGKRGEEEDEENDDDDNYDDDDDNVCENDAHKRFPDAVNSAHQNSPTADSDDDADDTDPAAATPKGPFVVPKNESPIADMENEETVPTDCPSSFTSAVESGLAAIAPQSARIEGGAKDNSCSYEDVDFMGTTSFKKGYSCRVVTHPEASNPPEPTNHPKPANHPEPTSLPEATNHPEPTTVPNHRTFWPFPSNSPSQFAGSSASRDNPASAGGAPFRFGLGSFVNYPLAGLEYMSWIRANTGKEAPSDGETNEGTPQTKPQSQAPPPAAPAAKAENQWKGRKRKLGESSSTQLSSQSWIRPAKDELVSPARFEELRRGATKSGRGRVPAGTTSSGTCHPARLLSFPNLKRARHTKQPDEFLLSVHTSTIPNAGRGLFLTYLGQSSAWKVGEVVDLGIYGPHRAGDIKKDFLMEIKNFVFKDSPSEWSFDGPPPLADQSLPPRKLFGREVDENIIYDITSDDTGCVHDTAWKTLLPFVNEVSVRKDPKKGQGGAVHGQVQNVDAHHHDDGSLHYILRSGSCFRPGVTTELLVYYGEEYEYNRNRKSGCYGAELESSKPVPDDVNNSSLDSDVSTLSGASVAAAAEVAARGSRQALGSTSVGSSSQPYYMMRRSVFTYTEEDIIQILDMFLLNPPKPTPARQRMHWLLHEIFSYSRQFLYLSHPPPFQVAHKMHEASKLFPRPKGDAHHEDDWEYSEAFRFVGMGVRKANRACGYKTGMVEGIVGWSPEKQQRRRQPKQRMYLVVYFSVEGEEIMTEAELQSCLMPNVFGAML